MLFVFIWVPLFEPCEIHEAEGGARTAKEKERDERIYSENEAKGERGPLVVTGLLYVSVEKKHAVERPVSSVHLDYLDDDSRINW